MPNNRMNDQSNDKKYFTQMPNIVLLRCETTHELVLWTVIKMVAGDNGECFLSTPDLADLCMMSAGKVSESRAGLIEKGLILGEFRRDPGYPQPVWHLSIPDLWRENIALMSGAMCKLLDKAAFKKTQRQELQAKRKAKREEKAKEKEPSYSDRGIPTGEKGIPTGETKNIHKEEPKEYTEGESPNSEKTESYSWEQLQADTGKTPTEPLPESKIRDLPKKEKTWLGLSAFTEREQEGKTKYLYEECIKAYGDMVGRPFDTLSETICKQWDCCFSEIKNELNTTAALIAAAIAKMCADDELSWWWKKGGWVSGPYDKKNFWGHLAVYLAMPDIQPAQQKQTVIPAGAWG